MPYLDLPQRDVTMFWAVNPAEPMVHAVGNEPQPEPRCRDYDPFKPVLVLLHGHGLSGAFFEGQYMDSRLTSAFNVVVVDSRCHGRTRISKGVPRENVTFETLAEDIALVLDHLEFASYAVFGEAAFGCHVACWIAVKRPKKVICLLMSSPGSPYGRDKETTERVKAAYADTLRYRNEHGVYPEKFKDLLATRFFGAEDRYAGRRLEYVRHWEKRYGTGHSAYECTAMVFVMNNTPDLTPSLLATVTCPVLILQGGGDHSCPIEETESWVKLLTGVPGGADLKTIVGGSAILTLCEPSILNRILHSFVSRCMETTTLARPIIEVRRRSSALSALSGSIKLENSPPESPTDLNFSTVSKTVKKGGIKFTKPFAKLAKKSGVV